MQTNAGIISIASNLPKKVLTNKDLENIVETSEKWIIERTGIKERRIADDNQAASDVAYPAVVEALKAASLKPQNIDAIITATITPDMIFPTTSCFIAKRLGIKDIACFDILAACSGFIYALEIARGFILTGEFKNVLVVAVDLLSKITDYKDRNTCVLFGDGAGACIVSRTKKNWGIISSYLAADCNDEILSLAAGGSRNPASFETVEKRMHFIKMKGSAVFKLAIENMYNAVLKVLEKAKKTKDDIALFIPHQANLRIIQVLAKRLNVGPERVFVNIDKYGNTSAASCAIALDEAIKEKRINTGDYVVLVAFGGGLTTASMLIRII